MYSVFAQHKLETVAQIQTEVMRNGPVTCGVHAEALLNYTGGIITASPSNSTKDDHALELIGWGTEVRERGPMCVRAALNGCTKDTFSMSMWLFDIAFC